MNILVVEDDELFALEIERLADKMGCSILGITGSGEEALRISQEKMPDLLLADVKLEGELTGIDLAKSFSEKGVPVILFTSYATEKIYTEALAQSPTAFLQKPFNFANLKSAIDLACLKVKNGKKESEIPKHLKSGVIFKDAFFIKDKSVLQKVPINHIYMVEAEGNYCTVYTNKKRFVLKNSLKKLNAQLSSDLFQQVHRNFVVQLEEIEKVDTFDNTVTIRGKVIPVGRKYWRDLINKLRVL